MKINIFAIIIFVFITIIILKIYNESDMFQLKCIVSDIDGNKYCVRERNKLELVADLLAKVTKANIRNITNKFIYCLL